ncbi:MAG: ATP-binding cassette domain-containing protein, partial [Pseudolabrys sp.]|nr:ATP-binding cassette domain-containing protein [Pseudolabrys sp.]
MAGAPIVSLDRVGKTYANGTVALAALSLDVRGGELVSLLGPSGCGKSTALRIVAGLSESTTGSVRWPAGSPAPGRIGFVFQEPTLMPWANVANNVALPFLLTDGDEKPGVVAQTVERLGLAPFANAYPRELSGGMKMRASIARALVTAPELLLMDEPFAALDEITRFKLNDDLMRLKQEMG